MATQQIAFEESVQNLDSTQTPAVFAYHALQLMSNPVRDRRTILLGELDTTRRLRQQLEAQVFDLQLKEERQGRELHQLDDWLVYIQNLSELSHIVEPYIKTIPMKNRPMGEADFLSADCLLIFEAHAQTNLATREIVNLAPPAKRLAAKKTIASRITYLIGQGKVERVSEGVYRLAMPLLTEIVERFTEPVKKPRGRPRSIPPSGVGAPLRGATRGPVVMRRRG